MERREDDSKDANNQAEGETSSTQPRYKTFSEGRESDKFDDRCGAYPHGIDRESALGF